MPRANRVTSAVFDAAAIRENTEWTRAVVAAARAPDPALRPGYTPCNHCRALTRCKAAKEWFMNVLEAIEAIGVPTDPDGWGELIAAAKIAERLADEGKTLGKEHLIKAGPGSATGWKIGAGHDVRTITDPREALRRIQEAGQLDLAAPGVKLSISKLPEEVVATIGNLVKEVPQGGSLLPVKTKGAA
jgi:hypothetical protein